MRLAHAFIVFAGLTLAVACLYWARVVIIPIALAVLLAFLLDPLVVFLQRPGVPRGVAVPAVVAVALVFALGLGWGLLTQVTNFANDLPRYRQTITRKISDLEQARKGGALEKVENTAKDLLRQIDKGNPPAEKPVPVVVSTPNPLWNVSHLVQPITSAFLVIVLVIFMLIQQRELRARVVRLFGYDRMGTTTRLLDEAGTRIGRYLLMQSIINACFGLGIGLGLFLLGLPFALALGCLAAVLRFLPYIGAWLAASIPIALSLAVFDGWTKPLLIVGLFVVTDLAVAFGIEPVLYGRSAGVSAIALLVAAAFWTWLWGPIGLALATPLTVCLVVASRAVGRLEFIEILMSDDPPVEAHLTFYQRLLAGDVVEAADLVAETAKTSSIEGAFDQILAPALARGRDTDQLTREEYRRVLETIRRLIGEVPASRAPDETAGAARRAPILVAGFAARDEADELGLAMLGRLLEADGCEMRIAAGAGLVGEALVLVETAEPALVCLGAVGQGGRRRMRHLVKRLRVALPDTPILAARWGTDAEPEIRTDLAATGADDIATSLAEAHSAALRLLRRPEGTPAHGAAETSALATTTPSGETSGARVSGAEAVA